MYECINDCMVWYGMAWYGMVWYCMVWYGMVWYGMYVCMYVYIMKEAACNAQENFPLEKVSLEHVRFVEFRWREVDKKTFDLLDANGAFEFESVGFGAAVQGQDHVRVFKASEEQGKVRTHCVWNLMFYVFC